MKHQAFDQNAHDSNGRSEQPGSYSPQTWCFQDGPDGRHVGYKPCDEYRHSADDGEQFVIQPRPSVPTSYSYAAACDVQEGPKAKGQIETQSGLLD